MTQTLISTQQILTAAFAAILVLSGMAVFSVIKFFDLKKHFEKLLQEKKLLMNILNNDLKVVVLAQQRALEILPKLEQQEREEIIKDLSESNQNLVDMLKMISKVYSGNTAQWVTEFFDFNELTTACLEECSDLFASKKMTQQFVADEKTIVQADREALKTVLKIILELVSKHAKENQTLKICTKPEDDEIEFSLIYTPKNINESLSEKILSENQKFSAIGQNIKVQFLKKVLKKHNTKLTLTFDEKQECKLAFTLPLKQNEK